MQFNELEVVEKWMGVIWNLELDDSREDCRMKIEWPTCMIRKTSVQGNRNWWSVVVVKDR